MSGLYILNKRTEKIFLTAAMTVLMSCSCRHDAGFNRSDDFDHTTIRIGTYNVKNMFDAADDPHKADDEAITPYRMEALAEVILAIDCDILALQEVENIEILRQFNSEYLHDLYSEIVLIEGNDPRGIDVAILSEIELSGIESFRDYEIRSNDSIIYFSRDLVSVHWTGPDGSDWTLLTTHLKSGGDDASRNRRTHQAEAIARIIRDQRWVSWWGRGRCILAGDLNAEPWAEDLEALSAVPFSDPAKDLPYRYTHASGKVLDYILLSPDADSRYALGSVTVYRDGPVEYASDHFPVYLDLEF